MPGQKVTSPPEHAHPPVPRWHPCGSVCAHAQAEMPGWSPRELTTCRLNRIVIIMLRTRGLRTKPQVSLLGTCVGYGQWCASCKWFLGMRTVNTTSDLHLCHRGSRLGRPGTTDLVGTGRLSMKIRGFYKERGLKNDDVTSFYQTVECSLYAIMRYDRFLNIR